MGYREEVLADNPWGYWREQEVAGSTTFVDESPNARTMTITGTPTFGLTGPVKNGKAVEWPANTTTYAKSAVGFANVDAYTLEAWVYIPTQGVSGEVAIVAVGANATGSATTQQTALRVVPTTGGYYAQLYWYYSGVKTVNSTTKLQPDTWYHIAAFTNSVEYSAIVVNGVRENYVALAPTYYAQPVWIRAGYNTTAVQVRVAEPAIYPTPLSTARLLAHYRAGVVDAMVDFPITVSTVAQPVDAKIDFPITVSTSTAITYMEQTGTIDFPIAVDFTTDGGTRVEQLNAILEVLDDTQKQAPTAVTVAVSGGWPNDDVQFDIDGTTVFTGTLDTDGSLMALSLPVGTSYLAGTHTVTMTSLTAAPGYTTSDTFDLAYDPAVPLMTIGTDADPVEIAAAQTSTGVRRWVLQDLMPGGLGSYILPTNPSTMTSPHYSRLLNQDHTTSVAAGIYHVTEVAEHAVEWQFSGFCHTQEFYEKLVAYSQLNRRFYLIDHRNRAWIVAFTSLDMRARKRADVDGVLTDWAHDYTVSALIYDQDWKVPQ
jgi:hypothetical protein